MFKRPCFACALLVFSLCGCAPSQEGASDTTSYTTYPVTAPVFKSEGNSTDKTTAIKAKVIAFDGYTLTVDKDGQQLTFTSDEKDNREAFASGGPDLFGDPLKKGHTLRITCDPSCTKIKEVYPLPEGVTWFDPDGKGSIGHIESLGRSSITFTTLSGGTFTAPLARKAVPYVVFSPQHIDKEYDFTGFVYPDGDILITDIFPLTEDDGSGRKSFGTPEGEEIELYGAAQVIKDNGDTLLIKRSCDGKELEILPVFTAAGEITEGGTVLFSPLTGEGYDAQDIAPAAPCCVTRLDDINGSVTFTARSGQFRLWGEVQGVSVKITADKLTDKDGSTLTAEQAQGYKNKSFTLKAADITAALTGAPEYYAESVTLYE